MTELSPRHRAFIDEMLQSTEAAEYGFDRLAKHPKRALFFDGIKAAGLLSPTQNSSPVRAKGENSFYVPYWRALDYLEALAQQAFDTTDLDLGHKVSEVILAVSRGTGDDRGAQDNYHTYRKFAEIVAKLPEAVISDALITEVKGWIFGRFDHGLVVAEIGSKLLPRLLQYPVERHGNQVLMLLEYVTQIKWSEPNEGDSEPALADDYWIKKLLEKNAVEAWARIGPRVIDLFRARVREIFSRGKVSWLDRPAIEDHDQNHQWKSPYNVIVEALRNVLLSAADSDQETAAAQLADMYQNGTSIERRIAIYVLGERFKRFGAGALTYLDERILDDECLHESYRLLKNHFHEFDPGAKARIFDYIKHIADIQDKSSETHLRLLRIQRRWVGALTNQGLPEADQLFENLIANPEVGRQSEHPDFYSYMTSWSGPGPSQHTVDELILFLSDGSLIDKLNSFKPSDAWRGPSTRALVDTFGQAIKSQPREYLAIVDDVLQLKRAYQYGFLNAFSELWSSNAEVSGGLDWNSVWGTLFELIEKILVEAFWAEAAEQSEDLTPTKSWIPDLVANLIKAGTREDDHAFDPTLLPQALRIITNMLNGLPTSTEPPGRDSEPMHHSINDVRGRVIDSLFSVALRWSRIADRADGKGHHGAVWDKLAPIFSSELNDADGKNFEFTTLAANYCAHIHYLGPEWFQQNHKGILAPQDEDSFRCAMSGLAYAPANKMLYEMLRSTGALERALRSNDLHKQAREKILERVALAYLWGQATLESDTVAGLFNVGREEDLSTVISFFWSVSEQDILPEHKKSVISLWRFAATRALKQDQKHAMLLAKLATLVSYLETLDDADTELLTSLAAYVNADHSNYYFAKELRRLVIAYPQQIAKVAAAYFVANGPEYDFEGLWLTIATQLHISEMNMEAVDLAEKMIGQPGFEDLYRQIRGARA